MEIYTAIGFLAAFFVTVALLPQVWKSFKTKQTKELSWGWMGALAIGFCLWIVYGFFIDDAPVIAMNILSFIQIVILITLKTKYG